jgi:hypothetical protein
MQMRWARNMARMKQTIRHKPKHLVGTPDRGCGLVLSGTEQVRDGVWYEHRLPTFRFYERPH